MISNSFGYCINYDSTTSNSCKESGCRDEGICRCSVIESVNIISVNIIDIVDKIYGDLSPDGISTQRNIKISEIFNANESIVDKYCINRILTFLKVYDPDNWNVDIEGGWYGQEVGDIKMVEDLFQKVKNLCLDMNKIILPSDKIKFILELEYGSIPDHIKVDKIKLISINKSDIDFKNLNSGHVKIVDSKNLTFYSDSKYNLPRGIVRNNQGKYRILDGHHRILSSISDEIDVFDIS